MFTSLLPRLRSCGPRRSLIAALGLLAPLSSSLGRPAAADGGATEAVRARLPHPDEGAALDVRFEVVTGLRQVGTGGITAQKAVVAGGLVWRVSESRSVAVGRVSQDVTLRATLQRDLGLVEMTFEEANSQGAGRKVVVLQDKGSFVVKAFRGERAYDPYWSGSKGATASLAALLLFIRACPETAGKEYGLEVWSELEGEFVAVSLRSKGVADVTVGTQRRPALSFVVTGLSPTAMTVYVDDKTREFLEFDQESSSTKVLRAGLLPPDLTRARFGSRVGSLFGLLRVAVEYDPTKDGSSILRDIVDIHAWRKQAESQGINLTTDEQAEREAVKNLRLVWDGKVRVEGGTLDDVVLSELQECTLVPLSDDLCEVRFGGVLLKGLYVSMLKSGEGWRVVSWRRRP